MLKEYKEVVAQEFAKKADGRPFKEGRNHLSYNITLENVRRFLEKEIFDLTELHKAGESQTILGLEVLLDGEMQVEIGGQPIAIRLRGMADRIDTTANITRLVDYKTGMVSESHLNIGAMEDLALDPKYDKALQLLLYKFMYSQANPAVKQVEAGIISFRKLGQGFIPLTIKENEEDDKTWEHLLQNLVAGIVHRMLDKEEPFRHNQESEYCSFCA